MIGPFKAGLLGAVLSSSLAVSDVHAASLHVYLAPPPPAGEAATQRIFAELEQYGYIVSWAGDASSPCSAEARAQEPPGAWIAIDLDAASNQTLATICFWGSGASPERASVAAPVADDRQLALAALEALNGLSTAPIRRATLSSPFATALLPRVREPAPAAAIVHTSLAFDVFGGPPVLGAGVALDVSLDEALSLELDSFVPVRASVAQGEQRELSLNVAWLRFGPRLAWRLAQVRLGVSLGAGAALLWAKARTTPPLIGTLDVAPAGLVSSGAWLEFPQHAPLFFRVEGWASRLLPSIELELGTGTALPFGNLLIDCGIGLGVRWDRVP